MEITFLTNLEQNCTHELITRSLTYFISSTVVLKGVIVLNNFQSVQYFIMDVMIARWSRMIFLQVLSVDP